MNLESLYTKLKEIGSIKVSKVYVDNHPTSESKITIQGRITQSMQQELQSECAELGLKLWIWEGGFHQDMRRELPPMLSIRKSISATEADFVTALS